MYIYIHIHIYTHTHTYTYTCLCMYVFYVGILCVCVCAYRKIDMYTYIHKCMENTRMTLKDSCLLTGKDIACVYLVVITYIYKHA
jgi:hypothetical protein